MKESELKQSRKEKFKWTLILIAIIIGIGSIIAFIVIISLYIGADTGDNSGGGGG